MIGMAESLPAGIERLDPLGLAALSHPFGRTMTTAEIDATIGPDGIEIHGAHGYLSDQFLWLKTDARNDSWGGSATGRMRFAAELVRTVKATTAPDFPLSLRLSQWKQLDYAARLAIDPGELAALVKALANAGERWARTAPLLGAAVLGARVYSRSAQPCRIGAWQF